MIDRKILNTEVFKEEPDPVGVAIDIKKEIERYKSSGDRQELVDALKDRFLIARHQAASKSEEARMAALTVLITKIPDMSENMLLRVIDTLAKVGEIDIQAITGVFPGKGSMFSLNQFIGGSQGGSPMSKEISSRTNSEGNPVKNAGNLLEALEHLSSYLNDKKPKIIEYQPEDKKDEK